MVGRVPDGGALYWLGERGDQVAEQSVAEMRKLVYP